MLHKKPNEQWCVMSHNAFLYHYNNDEGFPVHSHEDLILALMNIA